MVLLFRRDMKKVVDTIITIQKNWTIDLAQIMCQMRRKQVQLQQLQLLKRLHGLRLLHNLQSSRQGCVYF